MVDPLLVSHPLHIWKRPKKESFSKEEVQFSPSTFKAGQQFYQVDLYKSFTVKFKIFLFESQKVGTCVMIQLSDTAYTFKCCRPNKTLNPDLKNKNKIYMFLISSKNLTKEDFSNYMIILLTPYVIFLHLKRKVILNLYVDV